MSEIEKKQVVQLGRAPHMDDPGIQVVTVAADRMVALISDLGNTSRSHLTEMRDQVDELMRGLDVLGRGLIEGVREYAALCNSSSSMKSVCQDPLKNLSESVEKAVGAHVGATLTVRQRKGDAA